MTEHACSDGIIIKPRARQNWTPIEIGPMVRGPLLASNRTEVLTHASKIIAMYVWIRWAIHASAVQISKNPGKPGEVLYW